MCGGKEGSLVGKELGVVKISCYQQGSLSSFGFLGKWRAMLDLGSCVYYY
jgi:hypothetical protein